MKVAQEEGLVFNSKKCVIKTNKIDFFGNRYTDTGDIPDSAKVEVLCQMPTPQDKDDLHRFLGMTTYLPIYVPNFAAHAQPL